MGLKYNVNTVFINIYNNVFVSVKNILNYFVRNVSLFSGGGGGGEGHNFFPLVCARVTIFSKVFRGGSYFFKNIFIEKIIYKYPAAAGFRFLLILPLPSKKKYPEGRNNLYEFRRTILHLEGGSNR